MSASRGDEPPDRSTAGVGLDRASDECVSVNDARTSESAGDEVDVDRLRSLAVWVMRQMEVPAGMTVDVACIDVGEMADLNREHMGGDGPTDVLAFPLDVPGEVPPGVPAILGDVVLCPSVAASQASESGTSPGAELDMLLVHGILHLLGYDHQEPEERAEMFGLTDRLLVSFTEKV